MGEIQNLSGFRVPDSFRGRPAFFVQLWWVVEAILVRHSPQIMYGWRRFWYRLFGAHIGRGVLMRPGVRITYPWKVSIGDYSWIGDDVELYSLGEIRIGSNAVVSQKSYLCTGSHDFRNADFRIFQKPIVIEDEAWVAADVFVAPGVTVGKGAVIGARSTVLSDIQAGVIAAGYPAKVIGLRGVK